MCLDGPENIAVTRTPADSVLKKGSNLTLTCSANSDPPAQLRWMFNGAELLQKAIVTISNLEEKHSGNYSCVAYNAKTNRNIISQVASVTVLGKSKYKMNTVLQLMNTNGHEVNIVSLVRLLQQF